MTSRIDLLLEAEKRGILPSSKFRLLQEARRRGLINEVQQSSQSISSQRQAERASLEALKTDPPDTSQQPVLPGMTGGMMTPETMTMLTATGGTALGMPAGPAGMVAGGGLGAAAGPPAFNVLENITRRLKGLQPYRRTVGEAFEEAGREGMTDLAFSAATMGAGPILRRLGKPLLGKVLGTMTPKARRMSDMSTAMGIDLGAAHVSSRKFVKGASKVLGVFPFVGTPLREGQARVVGQLDKQAADLLNTLAPRSTVPDVGKVLTKKAEQRYRATDRVASSLYKRFYDLADNLSVREVLPTAPLREALEEITSRQARETITLVSGEPMKGFGPDELGNFLEQIGRLPEMITVEQARGLERTFNRILRQAKKDGFDVSRLSSMKEAMQEAKNSLDISRLAPGEAEEVVGAWNRANAFFSETRRVFETPTAKRFGRVDRNIFGRGVFKSGTVNSDDVFKDVFRARSPEALDDLRKLVGDREFRRASRAYLADAFEKAHLPAKEGSLVDTLFSAADFENRLGLGKPEGWETLETMLRGSGVSVRDWRNFLEVAKTATDITIRDPSTFLTRRLVIGGSLVGGMVIAGGKVTLPAAAFITWLARRSAKGLMNREQLRLLTRVLEDTTGDHARRTAMVRLVRLATDSDRPERPTGRLQPALQATEPSL